MVMKLKEICELVLSQEVGIPILVGICIVYLIAKFVLYRGDKEGNKAKRRRVVMFVDNMIWLGMLLLIVAIIVVVRGGETIDVTFFGNGNLQVIKPINVAEWFI